MSAKTFSSSVHFRNIRGDSEDTCQKPRLPILWDIKNNYWFSQSYWKKYGPTSPFNGTKHTLCTYTVHVRSPTGLELGWSDGQLIDCLVDHIVATCSNVHFRNVIVKMHTRDLGCHQNHFWSLVPIGIHERLRVPWRYRHLFYTRRLTNSIAVRPSAPHPLKAACRSIWRLKELERSL
jgi:hypothetical protein